MEKNEKTNGFIYLLREREFIRLKEQTYKIGKTAKENPFLRISQYPKGSEIILISSVSNCHCVEYELKIIFKTKFKQMVNYGLEYFNGDELEMKKVINEYIHEYEKCTNNNNKITISETDDAIEIKTNQKDNIEIPIGVCDYCEKNTNINNSFALCINNMFRLCKDKEGGEINIDIPIKAIKKDFTDSENDYLDIRSDMDKPKENNNEKIIIDEKFNENNINIMKCHKCKKTQSLTCFSQYNNGKNYGYRNSCKTCCNEQRKARRNKKKYYKIVN